MIVSLALATWAVNLLILLMLAVAVLLILTVLIQRPQGGGLSAAFGSAGSGQTAFGTKTGDALTVATVIMFIVFVLVAIGLNFGMKPVVPSDGTTMQAAPGDTSAPPAVMPEDATPAPGTPADSTTAPGATPTPSAPAGDTPSSPHSSGGNTTGEQQDPPAVDPAPAADPK
jgi:preprotein translocase subunit SecG